RRNVSERRIPFENLPGPDASEATPPFRGPQYHVPMPVRPTKPKASKLHGRIALVTGASRGAGRAIAAVLGEHGATVYVSARSVRGEPTTDNLPGTIEEAAEEVTRRGAESGGQGIPVRCDHSSEPEVEALFQKIRAAHGHLDLLVNNAWGGYEGTRLMPSY